MDGEDDCSSTFGIDYLKAKMGSSRREIGIAYPRTAHRLFQAKAIPLRGSSGGGCADGLVPRNFQHHVDGPVGRQAAPSRVCKSNAVIFATEIN